MKISHDENTQELLLPGVKVVEVASYAAGPATGVVLSDFGAEVIHIEEPSRGDPYRGLVTQSTLCDESDVWFNPSWELVNHNKRSITLSLKTPEGRAAFERLLRQADVFITNMLPSRREQLQLRYEDLQQLNERLIYVGITGYGEDGPLKNRPGYDASAFWAASGIMGMYAEVCGEPPMCRGGMGDRAAGVIAAGAVGLALYNREKTGKGQAIGVSLLHVGMWQAGMDIQRTEVQGSPFPYENRTSSSNPYWNSYRTKDGRWIFLALFADWSWEHVCRGLEMEELIGDARFATAPLRKKNKADTIAALDRAFARRTLAEWDQRLTEFKLVFSPVLLPHEVAANAQATANRMFFEARHSRPEIGTYRLLRNPMNFSRTPARFRSPGPAHGAHTQEVLAEAGFAPDEIERIIAAQAGSTNRGS